MNDFDPDSQEDTDLLASPFWVVYCTLLSPYYLYRDVSTTTQPIGGGRTEVVQLLLGNRIACPTNTADDPDPINMRRHPITRPTTTPPSPTTRFIPILPSKPLPPLQRQPHLIPGTFFIFPDISIRKAGSYRLQFTLMKMDHQQLSPGGMIHSIDTAISEIFKVVNAKDFDQVQPSTALVRGLLDRGAGYPLKLKKGTREGQRRRRPQSGEDTDDDSDDADEN